MTRRPRIVVLGMMTKMPVGGVVWQTVHYLLGFARLGYEPWYVEAHARTPSMFMERETDDGSGRAAEFIAGVMERCGLKDQWAYHGLHADDAPLGLDLERLTALYESAELIINLHGGTRPRPEFASTGRLVYLETDPVQLQVELSQDLEETVEFLEHHCAYFTFAENLGGHTCGLPLDPRFDFRPTRQPVVLDLWQPNPPPPASAPYTTVGNWRQRWRTVTLDGERYSWSKDQEWRKFLDLPERSDGRSFELALSAYESEDRRDLEDRGWRVIDALPFSADADSYRDYVKSSRGEFTVAKDQNVRLRSGWFSDRSATYLAAGRPVVTQDTGFDAALPVGEGLFAVADVDEAAEAIARIESDYPRHSSAAAGVAREHFDAARVLGKLLLELGLPSHAGRPARSSRPRSTAGTTSVVVPCFNLGAYLDEAIESVLAQTQRPKAVIVVDDGSDDARTLEALAGWERREGVQVLRTENRGASAARNHGIERTDTEYVLCLDADDVLLPEYLALTSAALDNDQDAGICATGVEFFGARSGTWTPVAFDADALLSHNCVPSASLFRRSCWEEAGGYGDLPGCQDWDLWLSIVGRGWRWTAVDRTLYRYRQRNGSLSALRERDRRAILEQLIVRHPEMYERGWKRAILDLDGEAQGLRRGRGGQGSDPPAAPGELFPAATGATVGELRDRLDTLRAETTGIEAELERLAVVESVRRAVFQSVPPGSAVAIVSGGDDQMVDLEDVDARHFPMADDGRWAGDVPAPESVADAIALIDEHRAAGVEYLVIPASVSGLEGGADLERELAARYRVVRHDRGALLVDVTEYRSFTVAICTHDRAPLLEAAIESVFNLDYPKDRYSVVVVDNGSSDDTPAVVERCAHGAPVPYAADVEPRNGLSFARNRAIGMATGEFVAFLDDDAVASPRWLRSLNRVINREHALVVGGRVEKAFEPGFTPPPWFEAQYVKHHFGVNYRERGRDEPVFRIRHPLYLTGANIAFARRLFDRFGGFPTDLGRDEKTLAACEETYLSLVLEEAGVPIFYSDEAYVEHFVGAERVESEHLRSKSWWSGASTAQMNVAFFGPDAAREKAREAQAELERCERDVEAQPEHRDAFAWMCRGIFCRSLVEHTEQQLAEGADRRARREDVVALGLDEWVEEVSGWIDGAEKHLRLYELHVERGDVDAAAAALAAMQACRLRHAIPVDADLTGPLERLKYERVVATVQQTVPEALPHGARVAVATRGDDDLVALPGVRATHFPQASGGVYAGWYPADSDDAIAHVEELRRQGIQYLVFPQPCRWWLEHYDGLADHLARHAAAISGGPAWTAFELDRTLVSDSGGDDPCEVVAAETGEPRGPAEPTPAAERR